MIFTSLVLQPPVVATGGSLEAARPPPFSTVEIFSPGRLNYDVSTYGRRAVVFPVPPAWGGSGLRVTLRLNFLDELRRH